MSLTRIYRYVCCEMIFFFWRFHQSLAEKPYKCSPWNNSRSIAFLRHLWRQSMRKVTVRLRFIETRLKQGYDLRGYFLNLTRETINILAIVVFHYLSWWTFFSSSRREMFSKKGFLKFSQNLKIPFETLRLCYRCLNFVVLLKLVSAIF